MESDVTTRATASARWAPVGREWFGWPKKFDTGVYNSLAVLYYLSISRNASHDHTEEHKMPVKQSFEIKAKAVKQGDYVTHYGEVLSRDSKVKWTTITFQPKADFAETLRVENDADVTVIREVPTEEEKAAKQLRAKLENLDWRDRQAHEFAAESRAKVATALASGGLPQYYMLEQVYVSTYVAAIWDRVAHVSRVRAQSEDKESIARLEAVKLIAEKITDELIENGRFLSRSTSVTNNWQEDCERQAKLDFLNDLKWVLLLG